MSNPYESATLILKLYDLRRESKLRAAREWYLQQFHPQSLEDVLAVLKGEHSAYFRMVTSYWEMVASLVSHDAIDWKMLIDSSPGEPFTVFARLYPFLAELRDKFPSQHGEPNALEHLERLIMRLPHAKERLAQRA
jgi:hypothetical protein